MKILIIGGSGHVSGAVARTALKQGHTVWTIMRPCHIYGPTSQLGCLPLHGRDPELIVKLHAGKPLQLVGGGHFLQQPILADDLAQTILSVPGNTRAQHMIFNTAGPDIIESWQYYRIVADVLEVELTVEEAPVSAYRAEHPEAAPFLCHRIYDLRRLEQYGLQAATLVKDGQATAIIALPLQPDDHEKLAAADLVEHVAKMSGATLEVVNLDAAGLNGFLTTAVRQDKTAVVLVRRRG